MEEIIFAEFATLILLLFHFISNLYCAHNIL